VSLEFFYDFVRNWRIWIILGSLLDELDPQNKTQDAKNSSWEIEHLDLGIKC